jgi:hypothetical protein
MPAGVRHSPGRHPTGGRIVDAGERTGPRRRTWIMLLILLAGVFAALRGIHGLAEPPDPISIFTDKVVVVGTAGHTELSAADRDVISSRLDQVQAGTVSIRPRYVGDCAAAGWTTLGAGRRAAVGNLCTPEVRGLAVSDWTARVAAAAANRGDARLGTLAASVPGCVAAVGPGAALAAAKPDGSLAKYQTATDFVTGGMTTGCPITIVDAGELSSQVITQLASDDSVTLIVTGVGPLSGSQDPSLQVIYRLGTTLPGWLTSGSTRRDGIVTLTDLTRTLIDFGAPGGQPPTTVDGAPFAVMDASMTIDGITAKINSVAALSDAAPGGYLILGVSGFLVVAASVIMLLRRRLAAALTIMTLPMVLPAAMMLAGSVHWERSASPVVVLGCVVLGWWLVLGAAALVLGRGLRIPTAIAAAALTVAAFTVDAALGAPMQPGSLLNSRPIYGLRWYGFGNVTFAAYATNGLLLAGYVAHRLITGGRPRLALVGVAAIGFGVVICEGWPSMGTDFGGVIALTPAVLWLLFSLSGLRLTGPKLLLIAGAAVLAIGAISFLDWRQGPDQRSHLGNFVQRIIDGDALDVVVRKAVASAETIISPLGIGSLVIGIPLWILIFRYALPLLEQEFTTLRPCLQSILITAVLGTLLNDGGISVWLSVTAVVTLSMAWFVVAAAAREGWTVADLRATRR